MSHKILCLGELLKYSMTSDVSILKKTFNDWCHQNPQFFPVFSEHFVTCMLQHINVSL